jgi:hypothetical protein
VPAVQKSSKTRCRPGASVTLAAATALLAAGTPPATQAAEVAAGPPSARSVTVYRSPYRTSGAFDLDDLGGFALVTETRVVHIPPGTSRVRFEGVADGIEPVSAIVAGLPERIDEKNLDGALLSPEALLEASLGRPLELLRTGKKTGRLERVPVTVRSDADGGVVMQTPDGIEALRCSGLPETLAFTGTGGLAGSPTLSIRVRSGSAVTRTVTLSYLSRGFDWAADYTATLSADETRMELGAWVTLANGNGIGFPSARAQVVAGRLNREDDSVEPVDIGGPVLANCWPRGSTSDAPETLSFDRMFKRSAAADTDKAVPRALAAAAPQEIVVTAQKVAQEQLGDLKLYRIPEPTDFASRESKQVRLLDRHSIPVRLIYAMDLDLADLHARIEAGSAPARALLRTENTAANHLGLPLPSGRVAVFASGGRAPILRFESGLRDLAEGQQVEIEMGESPDVRVAASIEKTDMAYGTARSLPLVPGVSIRSVGVERTARVDITNARNREARFELELRLGEGETVVRADRPLGRKNGRPIFTLRVPAESTATVRFQTQGTVDTLQRPR